LAGYYGDNQILLGDVDMRITYDTEHNIAYIYLQEHEKGVAETIQIGGEINIDLNLDGTVRGIELMNPIEQLGRNFLVEADKEVAVSFKLSPELAEEIVISDWKDESDWEDDETSDGIEETTESGLKV
jgi:uncharacterized protein YuzE